MDARSWKSILSPLARGIVEAIAACLVVVVVVASPAINGGAVFHGLDGAYVHTLIQQNSLWQPTGLGFSFDPIRGAGNLGFPLNTNLIAVYALQLSIFGEVTPVATAVLYALELFLATYVLALAMNFSRGLAIGSGWAIGILALPTFWYPLMYPIFGIAPHIVDVIAGTSIVIALFLRVGISGRARDLLCAAGIVGITLYLTVTDPLVVVLTGLVLGVYGMAALASAQSESERVRKIIVAAACIVILVASGSVSFLLGMAEYTAPAIFWDEFTRNKEATYFASIFYHGTFISVGRIAILLSVIEVVLRVFSSDPRGRRLAIGHLSATAIVVIGGAVLVNPAIGWLGPAMLYFEFAMWPIYAVFAVALILRVAQWPLRLAYRFGFASRTLDLPGAAWVAASLVPVTVLAIELGSHSTFVTQSFAPYPPKALAMSEYLRREVGLTPGDLFRGRVATFTGITGSQQTTWGELHGYDAALYAKIGNDLRFLGPWYHGIPVLQEYSHTITPTQYLLQSRFLTRVGDHQIRNISLFTRPDIGLLGAWGVRYVISDTELTNAKRLSTLYWSNEGAPIHLFELPDWNAGGYSPTVVTKVDNFSAAMAFLARKPDLRREIVLFEAVGHPLSEAKAEVKITPGRIRVTIESSGYALVLLPFEFSNCMSADQKGGAYAKLLRANIGQTALLVTGSTTVDLVVSYGIPFQTGCRRADARDVKRLGIENAARQFPSGVGR